MAWDFNKRPELWNSVMDFYYWDSPHKQITADFRGKVVNVHDGDTISVETAFRDFNTKVRMIGIDSLELNAGGHKAKNWLESQILNQQVDILVDPQERVGKWGRILGQVIFQGMNMNEMAIINGMAVPFDQRDELANRSFEKAIEATF